MLVVPLLETAGGEPASPRGVRDRPAARSRREQPETHRGAAVANGPNLKPSPSISTQHGVIRAGREREQLAAISPTAEARTADEQLEGPFERRIDEQRPLDGTTSYDYG